MAAAGRQKDRCVSNEWTIDYQLYTSTTLFCCFSRLVLGVFLAWFFVQPLRKGTICLHDGSPTIPPEACIGTPSPCPFTRKQRMMHFAGWIPPEICSLRGLRELSLGHNQLTGPIPASFGDLVRLRSLSLSCNSLNGEKRFLLLGLCYVVVCIGEPKKTFCGIASACITNISDFKNCHADVEAPRLKHARSKGLNCTPEVATVRVCSVSLPERWPTPKTLSCPPWKPVRRPVTLARKADMLEAVAA